MHEVIVDLVRGWHPKQLQLLPLKDSATGFDNSVYVHQKLHNYITSTICQMFTTRVNKLNAFIAERHAPF